MLQIRKYCKPTTGSKGTAFIAASGATASTSAARKMPTLQKGKGKALGSMSELGWKFPGLSKGKGKGKKGSWDGGKGARGEGRKGAYSMEDDWSAGFSG